ncbi:uncharacterized protein LOC126581153 [Anopheles aquasalis]|uniref:uncharacterized protein LOC126581153 n=1 Tax=Anopheles aquasalis TaxID=42839 RepID=UPI00215A5B0C|nr:uncharacterized protein LOC126581153 [Anopheles aquasalis]
MSATMDGSTNLLLECVRYVVSPNAETFLSFVTKHKTALIDAVQLLPKAEATEEVELALTFMQHYMHLEDDGVVDKPTAKHRTLIDRRKSLFEILLDLHSAMRATCVGFALYFYGENPITTKAIELLLQFPAFSETRNEQLSLAGPIPALHQAYCTMIVFDSCDLESASDRLAFAWATNDAPWAIRNVLVQETVKDELLQLVRLKLKPYTEEQKQFLKKPLEKALAEAENLGAQLVQSPTDASTIKPTLALLPGVQYLLPESANAPQPSPIVTVSVFRTAKEAVTLANANNGGSVSLWTEELSLTFEVAYGLQCGTVWVNSYAELNPKCPYTFRKEDYTYGSDYAVCEKKTKKVFAATAAEPTNSTDRNQAAIKSLGTYVTDTRSYRGSGVLVEKGIHYETICSPVDVKVYGEGHRLAIVGNFWDTFVSLDVIDRRMVLDTVHNQRKVICIPFGVTFAN